jgi:hypothetical protein
VETKLMKVAIRREDGYPMGVTAPCYLQCPCGEKLPINFETKADLECVGCDLEFAYNGWIIDRPATRAKGR